MSRFVDSTGGPAAALRVRRPESPGSALFAPLVALALMQAPGPSMAESGAAQNFYVRAEMSFDGSADARFRDKDCTSTAPAALYGCGTDAVGAPRSSLGDFGTSTGFGLGVGYVATPALRLEGLLRHRPDLSFTGRANFSQTTARQAVFADVSALSGMFAAYLDLTETGLPRVGPFRPFIGAGVGLSYLDIDETRMEFTRTATIVPGAQRVDFAWMLTAGLALGLGENTTLDFAWRYLDSGRVETGRDQGRIVWRDGSRAPRPLDLAATGASLSSHGLSLSLRYAF